MLNDDDLSTFFHVLEESGYQLPVPTKAELKKLIQFGSEFFPERTFEISSGATPLEERLATMIRRGVTENFLANTLPIICFLYGFRHDNDFIGKVKRNLRNTSQFNDTLFELKCLRHFHKNGFLFQYEPKVYDGTNEKNPDFRLTKNDFELFCECKQVRSGQNKAALKFDKDHDYAQSRFPNNFQKQLFDAKLRLEVNFKSTPSRPDLDELVRLVTLLSQENQGIGESSLQQIGDSIEYLVIPQSEPSPFPVTALRTVSFQVTVGEPFKIGDPINSPGGEISFVSTDLARRTAESFKNIIRGAKNQLPDDKPGIIVINRAKLAIAEEAIKRRVNLRQYDNIIAFIVNPFDDFWTGYRPQYRRLLFDLFEGFQPENRFKSN